MRTKTELNAVRQAYWDTLKIGLGGPTTSMGAMDRTFISQRETKMGHPLGQ